MVLIPTWLVLPPDDEDLYKEIVSTVFQSKQLFSGHYPFWDPFVAFGVPQPLSQTLNFHPFIVLVELLPLGVAIAVLYQLQLWIGILSVWGIARHLGIRRSIAAVCVVTYGLSSPTFNYLRDFWPVVFVEWTLAPLLLFLLLKLLDGPESRSTRAFYAVAIGLCAAFMILDGHLGAIPDYAIPVAAFLIVEHRRVRAVWPWLVGSLTLFAVAAASRVYDVWLESSKSAGERTQEALSMDPWRLLLYPIHSPIKYDEDFHYRTLVIGGPFVILAAVGLVYRRVRNPHADSLRAGLVVSFAMWFIPLSWIVIRSGNVLAGNPLTLFAIFLAGLTLQTMWERLPRFRPMLAGGAVLQVVVLAVGFYPSYRDNLKRAQKYIDGKPVKVLKRSLENQAIYRYFERRDGIRNTRVYMAPGVEDRLFRKLQDYEFAGWSLHGLRLVNGEFKGIGLDELTGTAPRSGGEIHKKLKGELVGDSRVSRSPLTLDALNVGYVLAAPGERVAPTLRRIETFRLAEPDATIVAYRNPGVWPDAAVLSPAVKRLGILPRRPGCADAGLLCADFRPVADLRSAAAFHGQRWRDTSLAVQMAPSARPRVLMISQLYRPGWRATLSDGRTVRGYRVLGGFTGFDLPPGVDSATASFHPTGRVVLTSVSWAAVFAGLLTLIGLPLARRLRAPGRAG